MSDDVLRKRPLGMERFALTELDKKLIDEARAKKLAAMTAAERAAYHEAEEADAMREALSEEGPEFADPCTPPTPFAGWGKS